ncbi:MAG: tetratricopeptide repeat protein [Gammaproteobacteria bacterium]|nr:tetratricopeptide repeat protein [Gammaproteobacteria bacterium]
MNFFDELKRRNVIKVSVAYMLFAWVILQVADVLLNNLEAPGWVFKVILSVLLLGLPAAIVLSWVFDWTPAGLQRTEDSPADNVIGAPDSVAVPTGASVAVLPFVNMSGDPENEYFSDGLTEELLNVLAKIGALKVAARTSSFHFKGQTGDIAEIGRRLGVATVLEGSVRQSGSRVRITAQLISAADGYHLWSESFDRELDDIFAVQDEISSSVANALQVQLLDKSAGAQVVGGTSNTEAFRAYLLGVHYRNQGDHEDALRAAIGAFQQAIDLDPGYAKAYIGLAHAWSHMALNSFVSYEEGVGNADAGVGKALELAPQLAEVHLALGMFRFYHKQDMKGADEAFNTARELNPGNVEVQFEYSRIQCYRGNFDEAIAAARTALELDPVSLIANHFLGHILYFSRRYDEAIPALRHTLAMDPKYPKPHYFISMALLWLGDVEAAWEEIQEEPLPWMKWTASAVVLHRLGRIAEAEVNLAKLSEEDDQEFATVQRADIYAQWGDAEMAFKNLDLAIEYGDPGLSQLLVDPFLDPIRDDPRFSALLDQLGFKTALATT